jgi:VCBS repeat protein/FG-GAP repeat protein
LRPQNFPSGHAPSSLVVVDVNKDGKLDLVVANVGTVLVIEVIIVFKASVSILLGDGQGGFAAPVALSDAQVPNLGDSTLISIAAGDLNNDDNVDLILAYRTYIQVLPGDGAGQFAAPITHASTKLTSLVTGDFDRDGKLDIATIPEFGSNDSNVVSVRFGDGAGNLGAADDTVIATNAQHLATGDFNLDDNLDLIASNGGSVSIILGDGAGGFGAPTAFNVAAKSTAVDDLNGDGKPDIIAMPSVGGTTGDITILLNSCGGLVLPTPTPTPTLTPTPTPSPSPSPSPGPVLLIEENTNHAIAFDSVTFTRGPFAVRTLLSFNPDQRTRIILFASNLELLTGEAETDVTAQAQDAQVNVIPLVVEHAGTVPGFDGLTQVVVKLPAELEGKGDVQVSITLRGLVSNKGVVTIKAGTSP